MCGIGGCCGGWGGAGVAEEVGGLLLLILGDLFFVMLRERVTMRVCVF